LYQRNLCVARLINRWQIGREIRRECRRSERPDVIFCSFRTIELSAEAVRNAREQRIPALLDIRDLWPDDFSEAALAALRSFLRFLLRPYFAATRRASAHASALIGVSSSYLDWGFARAPRLPRTCDRR
jgi:hypothetical protein